MKKIASFVLALLFLLIPIVHASAEETKEENVIFFGRYEQDNDPENGPDPIEWIVLDTQDGKALLISKYGLDAVPYNDDDNSAVTWETCTLRTWLNDTFLHDAFTQEEAEAIFVTQVDNSDIQGYEKWTTPGGNDTQDKLFLLSVAEAKQYFGVIKLNEYNFAALISSTPYAATKRASSYWWLRSPGWTEFNAAFVNPYGALESSMSFSAGNFAVRPALWLDLGSSVYESVTVETSDDASDALTLAGRWKGTSTEKGTGAKYDMVIDIDSNYTGVMRISQNGQHISFRCRFALLGTHLSIEIPANTVGLSSISATYGVKDGQMGIAITFSYTRGGSRQYSCKLQKVK